MSDSLSAKSSCCGQNTLKQAVAAPFSRLELVIAPGKVPCLHAKNSRRCPSTDVSGPVLSGLPFYIAKYSKPEDLFPESGYRQSLTLGQICCYHHLLEQSQAVRACVFAVLAGPCKR